MTSYYVTFRYADDNQLAYPHNGPILFVTLREAREKAARIAHAQGRPVVGWCNSKIIAKVGG